MMTTRLFAFFLAGSLAALASCQAPAEPGTGPPTSAPATTSPKPSVPAWPSDPVSVVRAVTVPPVPTCLSIRPGTHPGEGFDRITFDFTGPLPGYEVRYVDEVIGDGSGAVVSMPGHRYLSITFRPAQGHDDQGNSVSGRHDLTYPMLNGYVISGDFEAVFTVALGLADKTGFRIGELPGRIYVDLAYPRAD